jgi:hypothetical protein
MKMPITTVMLFLLLGAGLALAAVAIRNHQPRRATYPLRDLLDETNPPDRSLPESDIIWYGEEDDRLAARRRELEARRAPFRAVGVTIDMARIVAIESGGDPRVVSPQGCRGLCQIAEGTWDECVRRMGGTWPWRDDAFDPGINRMVANYYINTRIPQMLKFYGIDDTIATRIAAYNWGIGRLLAAWGDHGEAWPNHAPAETQNYIKQYHALNRLGKDSQ